MIEPKKWKYVEIFFGLPSRDRFGPILGKPKQPRDVDKTYHHRMNILFYFLFGALNKINKHRDNLINTGN